MQSTYHSSYGIIIKSIPFGISNKVITVFTEKYGKINIIAYGALKPNSRWCGSLELLNEVLLDIKYKQDTYYLDNISVISHIKYIGNLRLLNSIFAISEFMNKFLHYNFTDTNLYILFKEFISIMAHNIKSIYFLYRSLQLKSFQIIGYLNKLDFCIEANRYINIDDNIYISSNANWVSTVFLKNSYLISSQTFKVIRYLLLYDLKSIKCIKLTHNIKNELNISFKYLYGILNFQLKLESLIC